MQRLVFDDFAMYAPGTSRDQEVVSTADPLTPWWLLAGIGGALAVVQAIATLVTPPSETFGGARADYVADGLWAAALVFTLGGIWSLRNVKTSRSWLASNTAALVGQLALVVAIAATLLLGREALDVFFIVGFALAAIGVLLMAILSRRVLLALVVPALVLALAFWAKGGAAAFGLVWIILAVRRGR